MQYDRVFRVLDVAERRKWMRFTLPRPEDLVLRTGDKQYPCSLIEISLGGARIKFKAEVPPPTEVEIRHPIAGILHGDCRWHSETEMGVEFDQSEAVIDLVAHGLKQAVPTPRFGES